jgi:hypothetical protein
MTSPTKTRKGDTIRVTLDVSPPFYERLENLEKLVEARTKSDVIRQALQFYEFMAKKTAAGFRFRLINPDGREENLVFFHLPEGDKNWKEAKKTVPEDVSN